MGFKQVPLDLNPGLPPPRSIVSHGAMPVFATCPMISVTWDAYKKKSVMGVSTPSDVCNQGKSILSLPGPHFCYV